ncbi:MAG: DUF4276 family protein [Phycisphaerales bacterium]|nr:DUF4276 family protein [Phycisphaerales bacterium]
MHVVLLSEGNTDVRIGFHETARGSLAVLLQRMLEELLGVTASAIVIEGDRLPRLTRGGGFDRKVELAINRYADKADALVIVVDRGGTENRNRIQLLEGGRDRCQVLLAQKTAVAVAVEEMEAWLLADAAALAKVLGATGAAGDPESLIDPKATLSKLAKSSGLAVSEYYDGLARAASIERIKQRCRAFEEFCSDVNRRLVGHR